MAATADTNKDASRLIHYQHYMLVHPEKKSSVLLLLLLIKQHPNENFDEPSYCTFFEYKIQSKKVKKKW